jgi:hypothetical protein
MKAWHFTNGNRLRNGDPLPAIGEPLRYDGVVKIRKTGLHASKRLLDALDYAPGSMLHRVECREIVERDHDKFVCRERTILWSLDVDELLRQFARRCALDVIHLWDAPDVVVQYLKTGDETLRDTAWDTAWDTVIDIARGTAIDIARDTAMDAAVDVAMDAARDAAWDAARAAAGDATRVKQNRRLVSMVMAEMRRRGV